MGTKRPSCTLFDTLSNINMSDRKLQPGGKISRDPSPRPAKTAQSERDRDSNREEDRRREIEMEKTRDKARYKDVDPRERHYDKSPVPRMREGEKEWRERERRQADDRSRNGRPLSNLERDSEREVEKGKKGDTFPRMRKSSAERDRMTFTPENEKGNNGQREREREKMMTWHGEQREHEVRSRAKDEGRKTGGRRVDDERPRQRERYEGKISDAGFQDRGREEGDSRDRRERDVVRRREKPRPNMAEKQVRLSSPQRRRDREIHSNRKDREETQARDRRRDTRSEGDSDEREFRRERLRDRESEELIYQHSRSEGDNKGKRSRERDPNRQGYSEEDRQRDRERDWDRSRRRPREKDRERYKDVDRRPAKEGERWRESGRDLMDDRARPKERTEDDRYKQMRDRERKDRDAERRWDDTAGRNKSKVAPRAPPRSHSSGEWSSDMDSEGRYRRGRDSYEEREPGRESAAERDAEARDPERAAERSQREQKSSERKERERGEGTGSSSEQRRMWLEPQRGKYSKEELVASETQTRRKEEERIMVSRAERGRDMQQVKEEPDERDRDQSSYRQRHAERDESSSNTMREAEGVSVDGEEVWRETEKGEREYLSDSSGGIEGGWERCSENTTDTTEDSDREEEGGRHYLVSSEQGGGSESGWRQERDSLLSVEDGFVTVSSGGDEEDEREEDESEEFTDCQEFWGGEHDGSQPVGLKGHEGDKERTGEQIMRKEEAADEQQGREKQYVFCVIGQTLPRSKSGDTPLSQAAEMGVEREKSRHHSDDVTQQYQGDQRPAVRRRHDDDTMTGTDARPRSSSGRQEAGEEARSKTENPYEEIGQVKRDSQTEKLLLEWRGKYKVPEEEEQLSPINPYGDVFPQANFDELQPILDGIQTGAMSPEQVEAIRIRMSGAWSMSEEPKRHSQAPHLKWAKNVILEILGQSEEKIVDEPNPERQGDHILDQPEDRKQEDEGIPEPELVEGELLEMDGSRGMGQSQACMQCDSDTPTHARADTQFDTAGMEEDRTEKEAEAPPVSHLQLEKADVEVTITQEGDQEVFLSEAEKEERRQKEVEMYLSVSNTLYKPSSCPILNYRSDSDLLAPSSEGESQEEVEGGGASEEERQGGQPEEGAETRAGEDSREGEVVAEKQTGGALRSSCSFRDLGPEARIRRRGIRKTTERRKGELVEEEEEAEGVGRDRRTRIFSTTGKGRGLRVETQNHGLKSIMSKSHRTTSALLTSGRSSFHQCDSFDQTCF